MSSAPKRGSKSGSSGAQKDGAGPGDAQGGAAAGGNSDSRTSPAQQPAGVGAAVGKQFVVNYYTFLNTSTPDLHKFYGPDSVLSHGSSKLQDVTVSVGQDEIRGKLRSLNLGACSVRIVTVDSQDSVEGCVLVQVAGEMMTQQNAEYRPFVQTFLLAPQLPRGYYVRNDVFRFLTVHSGSSGEMTAFAGKEDKAAESKKKADGSKPVPPNVGERAEPEAGEPTYEDVTAAVVAAASGGKKKEWTSVTKAGARVSTPTPAVGVLVDNAGRAVGVPPGVAGLGALLRPVAVEVNSVYVRSLPDGVQRADLEGAFQAFGGLKAVEVKPKGFAFLEFPTAENARAVVAEHQQRPFSINGVELILQERMPPRGPPRTPEASRQSSRPPRSPSSRNRSPNPRSTGRGRGRRELIAK